MKKSQVIQKVFVFFGFVVTIVFLVALTFGVSWWLELWVGYPRGTDAISHLFRAKQVFQFWPNYNWFHSWAGGMPHFFWYPSLLYLLLALGKFLTSFSFEFLLSFVGVLSVAVAVVAVYLLVYRLTKIYFLSLASAIIYAITPGVWVPDFVMGTYSRGISIAFLGLALWTSVCWLEAYKQKKESRWAYFSTVIFLGLAFLSHYNGGPQAFVFVFILIWFGVKDWSKKILAEFKVFIPATFLAAFLIFPLIFLTSPSISLIAGHESYEFSEMFLSFSSLFNVFTNINLEGFSGEFYRLTPLLLPLIVITGVLLLLFRRKILRQGSLAWRMFLALGLISVLLIIYGTVRLPFLKHYGSGVFDPRMIVMFVPSVLAPMVAIGIYLLFEKKIFREIAGIAVIGLALLWFFVQFPLVEKPKIAGFDVASRLRLPVEPRPDQFNFRWGTGNYSGLAVSFNYVYPYVPQTRDYSAVSVVVPDYYTYLVLAGWRWEDNYSETNFLFDWWGVKEFVVYNNEPGAIGDPLAKFSKKQNDYPLKGEDETWSVFEYLQPSPILAATNAPPVLVIGSEETKAHNLIFRSLAQSDLNSKYLVPVHGKEYIDDYEEDELNRFPIIIISNYKYRNFEKAAALLEKYVKSGGGLLIESEKEVEIEFSKAGALPVPWPVEKVEKTDFGKEWYLTKKDYPEILSDINLENFAPAIFDDGPWGIAYSEKIKSWARVILTDKDKPVMVAGELGNGRVVWSGMNFPYHITTYGNIEESRLLGKVLAWLNKKNEFTPQETSVYTSGKSASGDSLFFETDHQKIEFVHPEKRIVTLKVPAKGVLFKEAYFPGWKAYLNDKQVSLYKAGPDFMYVPLENSRSGDKVVFEFSLPPIIIVGAGISLATLIILIYYLLGGQVRITFLKRVGQKLQFGKLKGWWDED